MPTTTTLTTTKTDDWYQRRLAPPVGRVRVLIDTDAANEIDDQFALAWALLSPDQLDVVAVYAEPFSFAHRAHALPHAPADAAPFNPPGVGMERSYEEILNVYDKLRLPSAGKVFRGSARYLPGRTTPVHSEAVDHLIATARAHEGDQPLYVVALGCVTNIASALLIAPDIIDQIVVVWTSAYPSHAPQHNHSFNLEQDLFASQYLFDCGVPHVYLPGYHVGAQLRLSLPEMERFVQGTGPIGDYLHQLYTHNPLWPIFGTDPAKALAGAYSWVIWDVINIAWLLNPAWVPSSLVRTPILGDDGYWQVAREADRHLMREAYAVERDAIFGDFFAKLKNANP
jgi:purine nucleosidase